jgi:hypothetical protein
MALCGRIKPPPPPPVWLAAVRLLAITNPILAQHGFSVVLREKFVSLRARFAVVFTELEIKPELTLWPNQNPPNTFTRGATKRLTATAA